MPKRYVIRLAADEREWMAQLVSKGKAAARKIKRAQVLLKADAGPHGPGWTDERISEAFDMSVRAIEMLRKRAVESGPEAAVERKRQVGSRATKLDGEAEVIFVNDGSEDRRRRVAAAGHCGCWRIGWWRWRSSSRCRTRRCVVI